MDYITKNDASFVKTSLIDFWLKNYTADLIANEFSVINLYWNEMMVKKFIYRFLMKIIQRIFFKLHIKQLLLGNM